MQTRNYTCGPAIVQAVLAKYGIDVSQDKVSEIAGTTNDGTTEDGIVAAIKHYGLKTKVLDAVSVEVAYENLMRGCSVVTCIRAWGFTHWVAMIGSSRRNWYFADPSAEGGMGYIAKTDFHPRWYNRRVIVVSGTPRRNSRTTLPIQRIPI